MRNAHTVWIDDGCDACLAANVFGVLLFAAGVGWQRTVVLCLACVMAAADSVARHPGGRPDDTSRELRGRAAEKS